MKPAIVHADAERELMEAAEFYEKRVEGLGLDFLEEFDAAKLAIRTSPQLWSPSRHGTRRYLMHRFPYSVIYLILPDHIWIVAVAHTSRRPFYWKERLKE
jgi:toxin ParE1/3/4